MNEWYHFMAKKSRSLTYGPRHEKTSIQGFEENKEADQPAHPHSLISAFVIRVFESIISTFAPSEISLF